MSEGRSEGVAQRARYRFTSLMKNTHPPEDHPRSLGMQLL